MAKRALAVLLASVCLLFTAGCRDYIEIHNMLIVAGIGLDLNGETGLYHATVEIVNVGEDVGENTESKLVEADGDTISRAMQNATAIAGGTMFGNHCKIIVIGDELAREGMGDVVDIVLRSPELRKTLDVMVARNRTARDILTQKTVKNNIVSYELGKMLRSNYDRLNNTTRTGMYKLHEALVSPSPAAAVPAVSIRSNIGEDVLLLEGIAVLHGDRLQGYLDGEQSGIYNLATRAVKSGYLSASDPALSPKPVGAKIIRSKAEYIPYIEDGKLSLRVLIRADVVLDATAELYADLSDKGSVEQIEKLFAEQISREAEALVNTLQSEYAADIFDFYREFENKYRSEWKTLATDWRGHFSEMAVQIDAQVRITGSGLIGNYAPNQEKDLSGNALP